MKTFLRQIKFAWEYFVSGKHRLPAVDLVSGPALDEALMEFLAEMFTSHGARAASSEGWLVVDGGRVFARAELHSVNLSSERCMLQTDFIFKLGDGKHIIESFGGVGPDLRTALMDACASFQDSTFHVLLTTLLDRPCEHVDRETWTIGGAERSVTLGWLRMRGQFPLDLWPPIFQAFRRQMETGLLPTGFHWVRCFYAHLPGHAPTIEVLIDNEPGERMISAVATFPWPTPNDFYSIRLFLVIGDASP